MDGTGVPWAKPAHGSARTVIVDAENTERRRIAPIRAIGLHRTPRTDLIAIQLLRIERASCAAGSL
jgi:hypothetical protein